MTVMVCIYERKERKGKWLFSCIVVCAKLDKWIHDIFSKPSLLFNLFLSFTLFKFEGFLIL